MDSDNPVAVKFWADADQVTTPAAAIARCHPAKCRREADSSGIAVMHWLPAGLRDYVIFHRGNNLLENVATAMGCSPHPGFLRIHTVSTQHGQGVTHVFAPCRIPDATPPNPAPPVSACGLKRVRLENSGLLRLTGPRSGAAACQRARCRSAPVRRRSNVQYAGRVKIFGNHRS